MTCFTSHYYSPLGGMTMASDGLVLRTGHPQRQCCPFLTKPDAGLICILQARIPISLHNWHRREPHSSSGFGKSFSPYLTEKQCHTVTLPDKFLQPCRHKPLVGLWGAIPSVSSFPVIVSLVPMARLRAMAAVWSGNGGCWRWKIKN